MNIFILDDNKGLSAQYHCDQHIVKMPLETAQILSTVSHMHGFPCKPYKKTHEHHPCVKWAAGCKGNYVWLIDFGLQLCAEYTFRYGKKHKCQDVIKDMLFFNTLRPIPSNTEFDRGIHGIMRTPFAQAMPEEYRHSCVVTAYRSYYRGEKREMARYNNGRQAPEWMMYA